MAGRVSMSWKSGMLWFLVLVGVHLYVRSAVVGRWAVEGKRLTVGDGVEMRFDRGGLGAVYRSPAARPPGIGAETAMTWWSLGPVVQMQVAGETSTAVCVPLGGRMWLVDGKGPFWVRAVE